MVDELGLIFDGQVMGDVTALFQHPFEAVVPGLGHAVEGSVAARNGDSMTLYIAPEVQNRRRTGLNVTPAPVGVKFLQRHMRLLTKKVVMVNHLTVPLRFLGPPGNQRRIVER